MENSLVFNSSAICNKCGFETGYVNGTVGTVNIYGAFIYNKDFCPKCLFELLKQHCGEMIEFKEDGFISKKTQIEYFKLENNL